MTWCMTTTNNGNKKNRVNLKKNMDFLVFTSSVWWLSVVRLLDTFSYVISSFCKVFLMSSAVLSVDKLWLFDWRFCVEPTLVRGPFKIPRFGGFGGTGGKTRTFFYRKLNGIFFYYSKGKKFVFLINEFPFRMKREKKSRRDNKFIERFSYYWSMVWFIKTAWSKNHLIPSSMCAQNQIAKKYIRRKKTNNKII